MRARLAVLFLLAAGCGWGKEDTAAAARLKAEIREAHPFALPAAVKESVVVGDEPELVLEPMTITGSHAFEVDILDQARREAVAKAAKKFSPLKGGLIYSSGRTDIGFWPQLVPVDATPVRKGTVGISIDFLRLKW